MAVEYDPKADLYVVLGIEATATDEEITKAHRALIRELHPDRGGDPARAVAVNVARDVLLSPEMRTRYDAARSTWRATAAQRQHAAGTRPLTDLHRRPATEHRRAASANPRQQGEGTASARRPQSGTVASAMSEQRRSAVANLVDAVDGAFNVFVDIAAAVEGVDREQMQDPVSRAAFVRGIVERTVKDPAELGSMEVAFAWMEQGPSDGTLEGLNNLAWVVDHRNLAT
jgi:curved DNA-binding protein CbpA